jgi:hypothetical protein
MARLSAPEISSEWDGKSDLDPLADSIAPRRLTLALLGTFALSALLLAIVGVYGVVAYAVARRTQEIGIRIGTASEITPV